MVGESLHIELRNFVFCMNGGNMHTHVHPQTAFSPAKSALCA
jgi:hypothetical protein